MNTEEQTSVIHKMNDSFKMPIYYNKEKVELKKNIITDLELIGAIDPSCNPIYTFCFNNDNDVSKMLINQISKYYTTDINFLKDNQKLIQEYISPEVRYTKISPNYKSIIDIWNELKIETGFKEKYYYVEWEPIEFLNKSETFLQFISIYNLCSPIISLLIPIIILIIPFFILKMKGIPVTLDEYVDILKIVAQTNAIGKLFSVNFAEINAQEKIYILVSAAFYLFSIYQNVMVCVRFNSNMKTIHNHFKEISLYLDNTIHSIENYLKYTTSLTTHELFNEELMKKKQILENINIKMKSITDYNLYNISKVKEIGSVLKYFYELHTDVDYEAAIMYSIGFNGYIDCIEGLQNNIKEGKINYATFINSKDNSKGKKKLNKNGVFKKSYYACLKDGKPIKNNIKFKKNMIITGPNASGKTTILKSTLINIILSQQFGCGFYESAKFVPFKHIHCYLNIPDTSGRDSLFQAEARRCKEILDVISSNNEDTHFCAFDELYSGTNPEEAETSASAFMLYIQKYINVSSLLTTHFVKVCKKLDKIKTIKNFKMVTEKNENKIKYTYKLEPGISEVKGGINVLTEMNYPKEIISNSILDSNNS
jgi:energy-coupling factor transporter ATP-binding protein EcfA2